MFTAHPEIKQKLCGGEFWTKDYYINTVSQYANNATIAQYVKNQGLHYQKLYHDTPTLFEGVA